MICWISFVLLFWHLQKPRKAGIFSGIYQQFVQRSQTISSRYLQTVSAYRWQNICRAYFVLRFRLISNYILTILVKYALLFYFLSVGSFLPKLLTLSHIKTSNFMLAGIISISGTDSDRTSVFSRLFNDEIFKDYLPWCQYIIF